MSEEKKIIIDEDWKTQVEAEREAASANTPDDANKQSGAASLPPASFDLLLTSLTTEAMYFLGQMPHPASGETTLDLPQAQYAIDMLQVLADKTKGNLTPEEDAALSGLVHQLRMAFVAVQSQPPIVEEKPASKLEI